MRINIELDVGFHRGGVADDLLFEKMLKQIDADPALSFAGLMGYEPHVAKVPGRKIALRDAAMQSYRDKLAIALRVSGKRADELTLNSAGSPTYQYYDEGDYPHNEVAAGSCLVKPSDFDLDTLSDHVAAAFIATPVLKVMQETQIPGVDGLGRLMSIWNPNRSKTFYTYGGNWKANPISPKGLSINPVWGHSTNQEMLNGSDNIQLKVDDWIFLRPTQSEFVFLQFGNISLYEAGKITASWPVLSEQVG
jgi:D-serine deaminase-like pyridoxal phosphate-dependent protein